MMGKVKCKMCGKDFEKLRFYFGHGLCDVCVDGIKEYVQVLVDIAELEREKQQKKIVMNDVGEFAKIKEGKIDIIRTSREHHVGEVVDISYEGYAYRDSVKCKVTGCHRSASDGYIIELINL